jgi:nitroreductase
MSTEPATVTSLQDRVAANPLLKAIWCRRVTREFTDEPVSREDLHVVLESVRWAPSAGNRRINKFIVVSDPVTIRHLRMVSPGMLGKPTVVVVILTDLEAAERGQIQVFKDTNTWIDAGIAAATMMLAAHALGLGSCPATSFSRPGVKVMLDLPDTLLPEFMVQLGHPVRLPEIDIARLRQRDVSAEYSFWERVGDR